MKRSNSIHALCLLMIFLFISPSAYSAQPYSDAKIWDGKFKYGAFSTTIAGDLMASKHAPLIAALGSEQANTPETQALFRDFLEQYRNLSDDEVKNRVDKLNRTPPDSIFTPFRTTASNWDQNRMFLQNMRAHPELKPTDYLLASPSAFASSIQLNTHRALYNNAMGIPANSLAAVVCAYAAGIRNIEIDVLETEDNINMVIHDAITNRLSGKYNQRPHRVAANTFKQLTHTPMDILNPVKATAGSVQSSGITQLLKTRDYLEFIHSNMPELTVYLDARNLAPVSLIRLFKSHPEYKPFTVIKLYPFALSGGISQLVQEYGMRYHLAPDQARSEIAQVKPNTLLVVSGSEAQISAGAYAINMVGNLAPDITLARFKQDILPHLPFKPEENNHHVNTHTAFTPQQLIKIEMGTYKMFQWGLGFAGMTQLRVLQLPIIPSQKDLESTQDKPLPADSSTPTPDARIRAAIADNLLSIYDQVKAGHLSVKVTTAEGQTQLQTQLTHTVLGMSDRYPDFTLAALDQQRRPIPAQKRDFYYSMGGLWYRDDSYEKQSTRSTRFSLHKFNERKDYRYITTDLPTDLRFGLMQLLGKGGLPDDVNYRPGAQLQPNKIPDIIHFQLPDWSRHLWAESRAKAPQAFDKLLARLKSLQSKSENLSQQYADFSNMLSSNTAVVNAQILKRLGYIKPVYMSQILDDYSFGWVKGKRRDLRSEYYQAKDDYDKSRETFKKEFAQHYP